MGAFQYIPDCGYDEGDDEYKTIIIDIFCGIGIVTILVSSLITLILSIL